MYLIEKELRSQFDALLKTAAELKKCKEEARKVLGGISSLCVLGCGSSFSLAKSAAMQFSQNTGTPAYAIPAGDLLVNFPSYKKLLTGSTLMLLSRSGSTSEVIRAARLCKEELGCKVLSICAKTGVPVEELADWSLCLPWAFDEAVCQTRTVSNLYAAALGLTYIAAGDEAHFEELCALTEYAETFCPVNEALLTEFAQRPWTKAVVLGDSGMAGILEEGALAFKEICRRDSNHYHLLDVRHGPMVQIGADTLVIAMVSSGERALQEALLSDLAAKTDCLLVLDCAADTSEPMPGTSISLPACSSDDLRAIYALYCIQVICLHHAMFRGVDPDKPEGLDAWIKL